MLKAGCDKMNSQWQIDLYDGLNNAINMQDVIDVALKTVKPLGFDYAGFRTELPIPLSDKRALALSTKEDDNVIDKAQTGGYDDAPVIQHCSKSMEPFYWLGTTADKVFLMNPALIEEYYNTGRYAGYAQSIVENKRMFSMFWVDSINPFEQADIDNIFLKMEWISTFILTKMNKIKLQPNIILSEREKEVLRWTGDGKTANEIGQILNLSHSTVNFHLRNTMFKLDSSNKTNAVVKAICLHLLH